MAKEKEAPAADSQVNQLPASAELPLGTYELVGLEDLGDRRIHIKEVNRDYSRKELEENLALLELLDRLGCPHVKKTLN